MNELEKQIAEIFELDAKRTRDRITFEGSSPEVKFYTSADKMVEIIRQQQEIIKGLSETIESQKQTADVLIERLQVAKEALQELVINYGFYTEERFILAKQALAIIEPKEEKC